MELGRGAHLPFPGHWARRWIYHWVCDAWPVRRQTYGYLPSQWPVSIYTVWWTTCPESLREAERPGLEPATFRLQVRRPPNHYATTTPHSHDGALYIYVLFMFITSLRCPLQNYVYGTELSCCKPGSVPLYLTVIPPACARYGVDRWARLSMINMLKKRTREIATKRAPGSALVGSHDHVTRHVQPVPALYFQKHSNLLFTDKDYEFTQSRDLMICMQ